MADMEDMPGAEASDHLDIKAAWACLTTALKPSLQNQQVALVAPYQAVARRPTSTAQGWAGQTMLLPCSALPRHSVWLGFTWRRTQQHGGPTAPGPGRPAGLLAVPWPHPVRWAPPSASPPRAWGFVLLLAWCCMLSGIVSKSRMQNGQMRKLRWAPHASGCIDAIW